MHRLAYSLRLGLSLAVCLGCIFALTRQAERNAATLEEFRAFAAGRRRGILLRWWKRQIFMLAQYGKLLKSLPELAGSGSERFRAHFTDMYAKVRETSSQSERGPDSFLNSDEARRFQSRFVSDLFTRMFDIKLEETEATALGYYALCSDAFVDFMEFCRATGQVHSREHLAAVLPNFTEQVQAAFHNGTRLRFDQWKEEVAEGQKRREEKLRGFWTRNAIRNLRSVALRPASTLLRTYWRTRNFAPVFTQAALPEWLRMELTECLVSFAGRMPRSVRAILAIEIHLDSCARLADGLVGLEFSPQPAYLASTPGGRLPESVKYLLKELTSSASNASGHPGAKDMAFFRDTPHPAHFTTSLERRRAK